MKIDHLKNETLQIVLIIKKCFPKSKLFIFLFLYLKFHGSFILSNSLEHKRKAKLNSYNFFQSITYYASLTRNNLNIIPYDYFLLIIYIIILIPLISCCVNLFHIFCCSKEHHKKELHKAMIKESEANIHFLKDQKLANFTEFSPFKIKIIKVNGYLLIVIVFLSQHIIEILTFCYSLYFTNNNLLLHERKKLLSSKVIVIYSVINGLFIIIVNIYLVLFYIVFNIPFLNAENSFNHNHDKVTLFFITILFNFQAIHYYPIILNSSYLNLVLMCLSCIILFFIFIFSIRNHISSNFYNRIFYSFLFFSFFSFVISTVMELQSESSRQINNSYYLLKHILVIFFTFISLYILIHLKRKFANRSVIHNLFIKNKNITSNYIYRLVEILGNFKNDISIFDTVDDMLQEHKAKCNVPDDCETDLFNVRDLYEILKLTQNENFFNIEAKEYNFIKRYYSTLVFVENEISNFIHSLYIHKKLLTKVDILLIHCDFIYYYRKNRVHALYLIQEYLLRLRSIPFHYLIYFYALKEEILKYWKDDLTANESNFAHEKIDPKFSYFYTYYENICTIKKYLLKICNELQQVLLLKKSFIDIKSNTNNHMANTNINYIALIYDKIMYIEHLLNLLKQNLFENYSKHMLKNPEVSYLLTNFFDITHKEIPNYIGKLFLFIKDYNIVNEFDTAFEDIKYEHPFIFSAGDNTIGYFSQKLAKYLKYKQKELIGANVHILLPPVFEEQHNLEMKRALFMNKIFSMEQNLFLIDKEGYYIRGHMYMGLLPTLTNKLLIICDLSIRNNTFENCYLLVMDEYTNLISVSSNFEERYHFTTEMIRRLGITFCDFFGFNYDKVIKDFKNKIESIKKIDLREINEVLAPFVSSNINTVLRLREVENDDIMEASNIKITRMKKYIKNVLTLFKMRILDLENYCEVDWMDRVTQAEIQILNDIEVNPNSFFEISVELKNMGNFPYFHVRVYDKDDKCFSNQQSTISQHSNTPTPNNNRVTPLKSNIKQHQSGSSFNSKQVRKEVVFHHNKSKFLTTGRLNNISKRSGVNITLESQTGRENISFNNSNFVNSSLLNSNSNSTTKNLLLSSQQRTNSTYINYINANKNTKKEYSHLSKDDLKKLENVEHKVLLSNKKSKYEKIIFTISICLMICLLILYFCSFFYKHNLFFNLKDFLSINIIITKLKQYTIGASQFISSGCFTVDDLFKDDIDGIKFPLGTLKYLLGSYSDDLFTEYNSLLAFFGKYMDRTLVQDISDVVYQKYNFTYLNSDYSLSIAESDFHHELNYFHYLSGYINASQHFQTCKIVDNYILNKTNLQNATIHEQALHYINYNVMNTMLNIIEKMLVKTASFLDKQITSDKRNITIYNIVLLSLGLLSGLGILNTLLLNESKIKYSLINFMKIDSKTKLLENKIENYKVLFFDLDIDTSMEYEGTKHNIMITNKVRSIKHKKDKSISHQNIHLKFDIMSHPYRGNGYNEKPSQKNLNLCVINDRTDDGDNNNNNNNNESNVLTQSNKLVSLKRNSKRKHDFINSINNNNNSNNNKSNINANISNNNNVPIDFSISFFSIPLIKSSLINLIFCLCINAVIIIINIYLDINNFNRILSSKQLSYFYLDRTPSYNQILLYYRISLLLNNSNAIITPRSQYDELLINFNNVKDETLLLDKQFEILNESHLTFLFYRLNLESQSIRIYELKAQGNTLQQRKAYANKINAKSGCCNQIAEHYAYYNYTEYENFNKDIIEHACLSFDEGVIDRGTNIIDNYFTYLINDYVEFCQDKSGNKDLMRYLMSHTYVSLFYKMVYVYNVSWETTSSIIRIDIDNIFMDVERLEILLQTVEIIFGILNAFNFFFFIVVPLETKSNAFRKIMSKLNFTEKNN